MEHDVAAPRIEPRRDAVDLHVGSMPIAEIRLQGLPRGAALVLCESGGLDTQAADLMNALAEHGYETLAADLSVLDLDDEGLLDVVKGLLDRLVEQGWHYEQIGGVGYTGGGRATLVAAGSMTLGGAVSISPSPLPNTAAPRLQTPWLGLFAEGDEATPPDAVRDLRDRLKDAPVFSRLVVYPGVEPTFFRDPPDALGHAAAFDAWQRVVEWFNVRVEPRPSPYAELWARRCAARSSDTQRQGNVR
jgi:carboxymethylenebutenolidase